MTRISANVGYASIRTTASNLNRLWRRMVDGSPESDVSRTAIMEMQIFHYHDRNGSIRIAMPFCLVILFVTLSTVYGRADTDPTSFSNVVTEFCADCHGDQNAEAHLNLEQVADNPQWADHFRIWRKVADMVTQEKMPPEDANPPSPAQRRQLVETVRDQLRKVASQHAVDPGPVTLRRLTSAEYAYTIQDLTGLKITVETGSDAVGGEGFANVGDVQFVQDSTVERYLELAKQVAAHLVVGAGPLVFYEDPGQTGLELSAIHRLQAIYRQHGFRVAAGEGGEAFGLEHYSRAMLGAWRFQHRANLGLTATTLAELAAEQGIAPRFADYIWSVISRDAQSYPASQIVQAWRQLPNPSSRHEGGSSKSDSGKSDSSDDDDIVREQCDRIRSTIRDWHLQLGQNLGVDDDVPVLSEETFNVRQSASLNVTMSCSPGTTHAAIYVSVEPAESRWPGKPIVIWKNATVQFQTSDGPNGARLALHQALESQDLKRLGFCQHPSGDGSIAATDFATSAAESIPLGLPIPAGTTSVELAVEVELDLNHGDDCFVSCGIALKAESGNETETDEEAKTSVLLVNPDAARYSEWKAGILEFAELFPQISHREPAPSDRDPIPEPFDNTYNEPERDLFHYKVKYHRDDQFLVDNMLDDAARERLDHAWNDLLGSFEYHDAFLKFVANKFGVELGDRTIGRLSPEWLNNLPAEPRRYTRELRRSYLRVQRAFETAQSGHLDDMIEFTTRAWRGPLSDETERGLRSFYETLRSTSGMSHQRAMKALYARILTAPEFLYRAERSPSGLSQEALAGNVSSVPLSDEGLASRLSYFLWSSLPDDELRKAVQAGTLHEVDQLVHHARRLLADSKSRRLAAEFFGQWFGFYQFDRFGGIDTARFPEFDDQLKQAMHDEALSFFEYVIREDRPVREILFADYSFVNQRLAAHYGLELDDSSVGHVRVDSMDRQRRGGLLGLGAVLTVTSAPLRTSPVKRGDWMLRRVLGTPVPPPPADAGSIPSDDVLADGLTVRKRLEAHRRDTTCRTCHSRIDPLGFALENFDPLGRWRETYRDGQSIEIRGKLADGSEINGPRGLRDYLREHESLFFRTLSTKLVGYALGRRETISDVQVINEMIELADSGACLADLVERIVVSRQFRFRRMDSATLESSLRP